MAVIERFRDREGREVVLTEAGRAHILAGHADMARRLGDVRAAVAVPEVATRDAVFAHRENHYRRTTSTRRWLKVVVHYRPVPPQGTWAGRVVTAYHTGTIPQKEQNLWP